MIHWRIFLLCVLFGAIARAQPAPATRPGTFDQLHQQLSFNNVENVTLELVPEAGRTTFHMGQTILLSLRFGGSDAKSYQAFHMTNRAGIGRLARDLFHVDPEETTTDPYGDYPASRGYGYNGGGPYSPLDRSFSMDLGDWVRFDKPGKYRLFLETTRLAKGMPRANLRPDIAITSKILELEILPPDEAWNRNQLDQAIATLAATRTVPGVPDTRDKVLRRSAAIQTLKNLQTEDAARALLDRMTVPDTDNSVTRAVALALYASRHRALVIEGLQRICADPESVPPDARELLSSLVKPVPATAPSK